MVVRSWWGTKYRESTAPVRVLVVNERGSPFGAGWALAGYARIHPQPNGSLLLTEGDGSALLFVPTSGCTATDCTYSSPKGDFTRLRYLETIDGMRYIRELPGARAEFHPNGLPAHLFDDYAGGATFHHDASGRLTAIEDAIGKRISFDYTPSGKVEAIRDPAGRATALEVNAAGDLVRISDPDGVPALRARYDAHRISTHWDRAGSGYTFAFDHAGQLASHTLPQIVAEGQTVRPVIRYRSAEGVVLPRSGTGTFSNPGVRVVSDTVRAAVTDARGNTTRMALDLFGSPTRVEDPLGRVATLERDEHSRVRRAISAFGDTAVYEYTYPGPGPTKATDLRTGTVITNEYTCDGLLRSSTGGARSVRNEYQSDFQEQSPGTCGSGSLVYQEVGSERYYHEFYGGGGWRPDEIYGPGGHTRYEFGARGTWQNTDSIIGPTGGRYEYRHDEYGRTVVARNPRGDSVWIEYDRLNRPVRGFDPAGKATEIRYSALSADTVIDANPVGLAAGTSTGVQFSPVNETMLESAIRRAARLYRDRSRWLQIQANGMSTDVSWHAPAREYAALYGELLPARRSSKQA